MRNYLRNFLSHFDRQVYVAPKLDAIWDEVKTQAPSKSVIVYDIAHLNQAELDNIHKIKKISDSIGVILLVGQTQTAMLKEIVHGTSWRVMAKPFLPKDFSQNLLKAMGSTPEVVLTPSDVLAQAGQNGNPGYHPQLLLGISRHMDGVKAVIDQVADTDVTILIRGESGTGKELTARSLYECSNRVGKPFVTVLCPAIPETLLESELFGFEKGSFTGAFRRRPGKFEIANHGTVFLDEIGDIPFGLQSKLLHVLQGGEFSRIGGSELKVNVRILAATNKDLEKAVADGAFREDLYYRLNVVSVYLPSLRERKEDIPLLTEWFLKKYNQQYNKHHRPLAPGTLQVLMDYHWPGNIRELENLIKRTVVMGNERKVIDAYVSESRMKAVPVVGPVPSAAVVNSPIRPLNRKEADNGSGFPSLKHIAKEAMRKAEGEAILEALEQTRWNRKAAARLLKISYKALLYKIRQCNLESEPEQVHRVSEA